MPHLTEENLLISLTSIIRNSNSIHVKRDLESEKRLILNSKANLKIISTIANVNARNSWFKNSRKAGKYYVSDLHKNIRITAEPHLNSSSSSEQDRNLYRYFGDVETLNCGQWIYRKEYQLIHLFAAVNCYFNDRSPFNFDMDTALAEVASFFKIEGSIFPESFEKKLAFHASLKSDPNSMPFFNINGVPKLFVEVMPINNYKMILPRTWWTHKSSELSIFSHSCHLNEIPVYNLKNVLNHKDTACIVLTDALDVASQCVSNEEIVWVSWLGDEEGINHTDWSPLNNITHLYYAILNHSDNSDSYKYQIADAIRKKFNKQKIKIRFIDFKRSEHNPNYDPQIIDAAALLRKLAPGEVIVPEVIEADAGTEPVSRKMNLKTQAVETSVEPLPLNIIDLDSDEKNDEKFILLPFIKTNQISMISSDQNKEMRFLGLTFACAAALGTTAFNNCTIQKNSKRGFTEESPHSTDNSKDPATPATTDAAEPSTDSTSESNIDISESPSKVIEDETATVSAEDDSSALGSDLPSETTETVANPSSNDSKNMDMLNSRDWDDATPLGAFMNKIKKRKANLHVGVAPEEEKIASLPAEFDPVQTNFLPMQPAICSDIPPVQFVIPIESIQENHPQEHKTPSTPKGCSLWSAKDPIKVLYLSSECNNKITIKNYKIVSKSFGVEDSTFTENLIINKIDGGSLKLGIAEDQSKVKNLIDRISQSKLSPGEKFSLIVFEDISSMLGDTDLLNQWKVVAVWLRTLADHQTAILLLNQTDKLTAKLQSVMHSSVDNGIRLEKPSYMDESSISMIIHPVKGEEFYGLSQKPLHLTLDLGKDKESPRWVTTKQRYKNTEERLSEIKKMVKAKKTIEFMASSLGVSTKTISEDKGKLGLSKTRRKPKDNNPATDVTDSAE